MASLLAALLVFLLVTWFISILHLLLRADKGTAVLAIFGLTLSSALAAWLIVSM